MSRSTIRIVAVLVLAIFGAPVAMHVVLHDLHDHHDDEAATCRVERAHDDHEHPIVSSSAPRIPTLTRLTLPIAALATIMPAPLVRLARAERNVMAFGALRTDTDVGLQPLLSTYLI